MKSGPHAFYLAPRSWVGWFITIVVGLILLALAAVLATAALVAGFLIAAVVVARGWWLMRKMRRERAKEFLSAEYEVERVAPMPIEERRGNDARHGR